MSLRCSRDLFWHGKVPDAAALRLTTYTVGCAFRLTRLPATGETFPLLTKGGTDATNQAPYYLAYRNSGGTLQFYAATRSSGAVYATSANVTLEAGRWYTVWLDYAAASGLQRIWYTPRRTRLNETGASALTLAGSTTHGANTPDAGTAAVYFGADIDSSGVLSSILEGEIAEVAFYSSVIAQATLESRLTLRLAPDTSGLVSYWRLDEGSGSVLYDRAYTTGRNGTAENGAQFGDDPLDLYYRNVGSWFDSAVVGWANGAQLIGASVTASSAAAAYPVDALYSPRPDVTTRTANVSGTKTWVYDLGRAQPCSAFLLSSHNLTSAAAILVEGHTADSWGSPAVSQLLAFHPEWIIAFFSRPQQYRYWRLSIADSTNADGYIEIGGGTGPWICHEMLRPASFASSDAQVDPSTGVDLPDGGSVWRTLDPSRETEWSTLPLRRGEAVELARCLDHVSSGGPVFLASDLLRRVVDMGRYGVVTAAPSRAPHGPAWTHEVISGLRVAEHRRG